MTDETPKKCAKCGTRPAGPGGILCPSCRDVIEAGLGGELATP